MPRPSTRTEVLLRKLAAERNERYRSTPKELRPEEEEAREENRKSESRGAEYAKQRRRRLAVVALAERNIEWRVFPCAVALFLSLPRIPRPGALFPFLRIRIRC